MESQSSFERFKIRFQSLFWWTAPVSLVADVFAIISGLNVKLQSAQPSPLGYESAEPRVWDLVRLSDLVFLTGLLTAFIVVSMLYFGYRAQSVEGDSWKLILAAFASLFSAYLYLSMAAHFEAASFTGMAIWMKKQAEEEVEHAMKFFDYANERGGRVRLDAIDKPQEKWGKPLEIFTAALEHEKEITKHIHDLVDLANKEGDHATRQFLDWFVEEQVEEEASASEIVEKLKMIGDNNGGLLHLDKHLGKRE